MGKRSDGQLPRVPVSIRRLRGTVPVECWALGGKLNEQLFLEGCLGSSTPTSKLCEDIPVKRDSFVRFAQWSIEECRRHQLWDRDCPLLLDVLSTHCGHAPGRKG